MKTPAFNDLTFVMLTYFRQSCALRTMHYLSEFGSKVVVMDGTDKPIEEKNLYGLSKKIIYFHQPVGSFERIRKSLDHITTKYVAMIPDDEFYIPSVVSKCIQELENDASLVACCGTAIGFMPTKKNVYGCDVYPELHNYRVEAESAVERVYYHMENYTINQIYAICRSKEWIKIYRGITRTEFPVNCLLEHQFELYMSFAGKSKVLPELMWLRNISENPPISGTSACDSGTLFIDWFRDKKNAKEINDLINTAEGVFNELSEGISSAKARKIAEEGFQKLHYWLDQQRSISTKIIQIIPRFIRCLIPTRLKKIILFFLNFPKASLMFFESQGSFIDIIEIAKINEKKGISFNPNELNKIKKNLLNWDGVVKR